jgi:hypothetical protein
VFNEDRVIRLFRNGKWYKSGWGCCRVAGVMQEVYLVKNICIIFQFIILQQTSLQTKALWARLAPPLLATFNQMGLKAASSKKNVTKVLFTKVNR